MIPCNQLYQKMRRVDYIQFCISSITLSSSHIDDEKDKHTSIEIRTDICENIIEPKYEDLNEFIF